MKKEEEKSYALAFLISSAVLVMVWAWGYWNETYGNKPWKSYQKKYYELELQKLGEEYDNARLAFQHPAIQKKYNEIQEKLYWARVDFKKPKVQREYKKILNELHNLDTKELSPLKFESIVTRNEILEEEFLYGKYKSEDAKNRIKELEKKNSELSKKIVSIEERRKNLKKRIEEAKSDISFYTDQSNLYGKEINIFKDKYKKLKSKRPELRVHQVYLADLNEADRCMSCHVGINRSESVSVEHPYAAHVRKEVYLENHPPGKYGCVLCHEGQARATTSAKKAHGEVEYWLRPRYSGVMAQASCIKCHTKDAKLEGGEALWKGIELLRELGCYGCHETEGFGKDGLGMIGPDLNTLSSKLNPEWIVKWLKNPKGFRPHTRMPDFKLEDEDIRAITSYLWQKSKDVRVIAAKEYDEEMIEEGAYLFESVGCLACHSDVEDSERSHGPNLARIGEKVDYDFLVSWLLKPKDYQPRTKMPDFRLDDEEAAFLAAYLMSLRSETYEVSTEETKWLDDKEAAERGGHLVNRYGCFGCHKIEGMEGKSKIGVELTGIGSKNVHLLDFGLLEKEILGEFGLERLTENIGEARRAWISAKLNNPKQFDEGRYRRPEDKLRMPDFGLNKDEVEALSIVLLGLREEELPKSYMYKMSNEQRNITEGRRLVKKYNCMGCHQFSIDKLILEDGSGIKGMVKLEEEDGLFFQLWEDNVRLGRKAGETARVKKSWITDRIKAEGGDIASFIIDYHVEVEGRVPEEAKVFTPPVLYEEGKKVQFPWLYEFVNKPVPLRPWLDIRMPTINFQPGEATSIVRYFATMDNEQYPYDFFEETDKDYIRKKEKGYLAKARNLFESKDINCASCHVRGDITPEGGPSDWAPDLSRARKRLKPDWIVKWLLNPQLIQPGTKMPRFFREGAFQDIFPGNRKQQVEAIKDLLMNFPQDMLVAEEQGEGTYIVPPLSSPQDMLAAKDMGGKKCVIRPWLGY